MEKLKVGVTQLDTISKIAASLRRRADQTIPAFSTMQIIEACFPGTLVTGRELELDVDEVVRVDKHAFRTHRAPHTIVYNRRLPSADQRYAIAHALGHIIFDGGRARGCAESVERECRCDLFADELLVPLAELDSFVCAAPSPDRAKHEVYLDMVDQIASQFHAPARVIEKRIRALPRR